MRRANRVVPDRFEQLHLSFHRIRIFRRAQQTIVMVDARAAKQHPLPVQAKAIFCVAADGADTEPFLPHILFKANTAVITLRMLCVPADGIRHIQHDAERSVALRFSSSHAFRTVENFHRDRACFAGLTGHLHLRRGNANCLDTQAVQQNVFFRHFVPPRRAVNTRASIPACAGHLRIMGNDTHRVLPFAQIGRQLARQIQVAVIALDHQLIIAVHFALAIDRF